MSLNLNFCRMSIGPAWAANSNNPSPSDKLTVILASNLGFLIFSFFCLRSGADAMRHFLASGYRFLAIEAEHAVAVESLPPFHQDPFDRILIAQALTEPLRLMTHDETVARYSDTVIRV